MGVIGILLIGSVDAYFVSNFKLDGIVVPLMSGAFGSSAVLLYGVYDVPLAQPRNVIGGSASSGNGNRATAAQIVASQSISGFGNILYLASSDANSVRQVTISTTIINSFVGSSTYTISGTGGQASSAGFNNIAHVATDSSGNVYIGEDDGAVIRKVQISNSILTLVIGVPNSSGNNGNAGMATSAQVKKPRQIYCDSVSSLYFVDNGSGTIRYINSGYVSQLVGGQTDPVGIFGQSNGILYTSEQTGGNRVNMINAGVTGRLAGSASSTGGFTGDGGVPGLALLNAPTTLFLDSSNNLTINSTISCTISDAHHDSTNNNSNSNADSSRGSRSLLPFHGECHRR
eukprot:gene24486-30837_t